MERTMRVDVVSEVDAPVEDVWARVATLEGVNHELMPVLSMRMPRRWRGLDLDAVPVGEPLGRAVLRLVGLVPVEYDELRLVAVHPPYGFHERSAMGTLRLWEHRRELSRAPGGRTTITDRVCLEPRWPLPSPAAAVVRSAVRALFRHRHRRLGRWFRRA